MRNLKYLAFLFIFIHSQFYGQKFEYKKHLKSIKKNEVPKTSKECNIKDSTFIDYALSRIIKNKDKIYITNRNLLTVIPVTEFSPNYLKMSYKNISIDVLLTNFDSLTNKVVTDENGDVISINNLQPYGCTYSKPTKKLKSITVNFGDKKITVPDSIYADLYEPILNDSLLKRENLQAYVSANDQFVYLYLYGGEAVDTYFTKLIINKNGSTTRWIADYYILSCFGAFNEKFIGW
jgi:hypothetical protein